MVDISLHDVADELGVHYMTVYRYVRQGLLPATKRGRTWFVAPRDVEAFRSARVDLETEPTTAGRRSAPWGKRLEARLVEGDEQGALEVLESALRAGNDLTYIYVDVLAPALAGIGERWAAGELGIHVEHRASGIALRLIGRIGSRFKHRGVSKGAVVMGAPAGEEHALVISMVADLVRHEGWEVHDLGANMPAEAFAHAVEVSNDVVAVCVGVTVTGALESARTTIEAIKRVSSAPVYAGGAAVFGDAAARELGADHWTGDARQLVGSLNQLARRN